jgi:hypothetical protein
MAPCYGCFFGLSLQVRIEYQFKPIVRIFRRWSLIGQVMLEYRFLMSRQCSRQGCAHIATVTLSYQYARSLVWLDDLSAERDPHTYDLCEMHAERLKPPSGWHLEDRRHRVYVYSATQLAG